MNPARTIALILAMSAAALTSSAQETTSTAPPNRASSAIPQDTAAALAAARAPLLNTPDALLEAPAPPLVAPASQPRIAPEHKFWDRQQKLALAVHSGVRLADTIKTCRELAHGGIEVWIPTQSCAGIAAWNAGSVGLALGMGWLFHRYGFHRLERITPWVGTAASAAGLTKSVFNIY